ncbi:MAG: hypothetical protein U0R26_10480 [Solirubrobacterales bacterium]
MVNDNRQYGNTVEHAIKIAEARGRGIDARYFGAGLAEPPVDIPGDGEVLRRLGRREPVERSLRRCLRPSRGRST